MMYEGGKASQVFILLTDPTKPYQEAHGPLKAYRSQYRSQTPQKQTIQTPNYFHPYLWDNVLDPASLDFN
jgi:hypothetical protein